MVKVKLERVGRSKVLIDRKSLLSLVRHVRKVEDVEVIETKLDLPIAGIMNLAEQGNAFKFLYDKREDVYSVSDVKVKYR